MKKILTIVLITVVVVVSLAMCMWNTLVISDANKVLRIYNSYNSVEGKGFTYCATQSVGQVVTNQVKIIRVVNTLPEFRAQTDYVEKQLQEFNLNQQFYIQKKTDVFQQNKGTSSDFSSDFWTQCTKEQYMTLPFAMPIITDGQDVSKDGSIWKLMVSVTASESDKVLGFYVNCDVHVTVLVDIDTNQLLRWSVDYSTGLSDVNIVFETFNQDVQLK